MNQHANDFWDLSRVQKLTDLQKAGMSCAQIAKALGGVTRSAVIGKLYRLGIKSGKPTKKFWTEEKIATLRRMWVQGYSSGVIASQVKARSAHSVIGKAYKIGLARRSPAKILKDGHIVKRRISILVSLKNIPTPNEQFKCSLAELVNDTCRWPLWDDSTRGAKFYCGTPEADCNDGKPYCRWHTVISTRKYEREMEPFR